jgi:ketosteroid isomerase-like protein
MTDPAEIVRGVAAGVCRLMAGRLTAAEREAELDRLAGFYAEKTDVRHPFAPLGDSPLRSRKALRDHFAQVDGSGVERFEVAGDRVHRTGDPEVVIFEFSYEGAIGGRPFRVPSIFVVRVRDGVIVESRDYGDHIGLARAFGRLPALAEALGAGTGPR